MLKKTLITVLLLTLVVNSTSAEEDSIKFGMILPLSGDFAVLGKDNREGIEIALAELANDRIEAIYGDSKTEPVQAINEFRRMININDTIAVFAFRGPIGMALNPISKRQAVPILGGVGNKDFALQNEYAFQAWTTSTYEGQYLAGHFKKIGVKKLALITAEDDWTSSVSKALRDELKGDKIIIYDEEVSPSQLDFRSMVLKIKNKNPDVIFVNCGLQQIGPFIRQIKEQNATAQVFSNFWMNKPEVVKAAGEEAIEGAMFIEMLTDLPKLNEALSDKFNSKTSGATLSAYLSTMLLGQTLNKIEGEPNKENFYKTMRGIDTIKTSNGDFSIKDRVIQFPLVLKVMRKGVAVKHESEKS